jgi:hypothetical protein
MLFLGCELDIGAANGLCMNMCVTADECPHSFSLIYLFLTFQGGGLQARHRASGRWIDVIVPLGSDGLVVNAGI